MWRKIRNWFLMLLFISGYVFFLYYEYELKQVNTPPIITVPQSVLEVSVKAGEEDLLKDVKATDKEDGDIFENVFIEDITEFDENSERTVTYAVIDNDNTIIRGYRNIRYNDYKKPEFNIKRPLVLSYWDNPTNQSEFVGAESVLDGDITNSIAFTMDDEDQNNIQMICEVADSAGGKSEITLPITGLNNHPNIDITLTDYLLRVPVGTEIQPEIYIKEIKENRIVKEDYKADVQISNNYNPNVAGIYEFYYELVRPNGNLGLTKLVVIVE